MVGEEGCLLGRGGDVDWIYKEEAEERVGRRRFSENDKIIGLVKDEIVVGREYYMYLSPLPSLALNIQKKPHGWSYHTIQNSLQISLPFIHSVVNLAIVDSGGPHFTN